MKRILKLEVKKSITKAPRALSWCFDDRFSSLLEKLRELLKEESGVESIDFVKAAN